MTPSDPYLCCSHCVSNTDGECNDMAMRGYHRQTCGFEGCPGNKGVETP